VWAVDPSREAGGVRSTRTRWLIAFFIFCVATVIGFGALTVRRIRSDSLDVVCRGRLKQIGLALSNYYTFYGRLPPAYLANEKGEPVHSWRVLLLPFLACEHIYYRYDFAEPWNGPHNVALAQSLVGWQANVFACPRTAGDTDRANYVAIVGRGTLWPKSGPATIPGGLSRQTGTILIIEIDAPDIHWMEPRDLDVDEVKASLTSAMRQGSSLNFVTGSDALGKIAGEIGPEALTRLLTIEQPEPAPNPREILERRLATLVGYLDENAEPYFLHHAIGVLAGMGSDAEPVIPALKALTKANDARTKAEAASAIQRIRQVQ
jgi:hypothetical protein